MANRSSACFLVAFLHLGHLSPLLCPRGSRWFFSILPRRRHCSVARGAPIRARRQHNPRKVLPWRNGTFCLTQLCVCMKRAGERWPSMTDHPLQKMHPTQVVRLPACGPAGFTPTVNSVSFKLKISHASVALPTIGISSSSI